jgi:hypothetical protein
LGQSPFADPGYLNNLIEHIKQHMTLWYLNRSNAYVAQARGGKPVDNYDDPLLTGTIDQLYTAVGAHINMDTKEVFEQFAPAFQQLIQMAQKRQQSQKQALPPDAQVVHDTSMAETQRKTKYDQASLQLDDKKLQADIAKHLDDNKTKIAIENAKLTNQVIPDVAAMQPPPEAPMMGAQPPAMMPPQGMPPGMPQLQGAPNGNV